MDVCLAAQRTLGLHMCLFHYTFLLAARQQPVCLAMGGCCLEAVKTMSCLNRRQEVYSAHGLGWVLQQCAEVKRHHPAVIIVSKLLRSWHLCGWNEDRTTERLLFIVYDYFFI